MAMLLTSLSLVSSSVGTYSHVNFVANKRTNCEVTLRFHGMAHIVISILMHHVVALANYTQVGPDINGTVSSERFGSVLSMSDDGNAFVVGAPYAYNRKGLVRAYQKDSSVTGMVNYIQVGLDIVGKADDDYFGSSVSMSGDGTRFMAATPYTNNSKGSVSIYQYKDDKSNYAKVGEDIVGKASGDYFGLSVSMSGDGTSFVAGAVGRNLRTGYVNVYKQNTTNGNYTQVGLDIVGKAQFHHFGFSVSMSGDGTSVVVGAPYSNNGNGSVSVYKYNIDTSNYVQVGSDIVGKAQGDQFGWSVSMSGDGTSFVAGAVYSNNAKGSASVYKYKNDTSNFTQVGLDIVGKVQNDLFGVSVSMSGDGTSFVAGATGSNGNKGSASVYKQNTTNGIYTQVGLDIVGTASNDFFGTSVSMSSNGATVVVGAPGNDNLKGENSGHVRLYRDTTVSSTAPTTNPTRLPTAPRVATTKAPSKAPVFVISPTKTPIASVKKCGFFGWNLFCPRRGECGFVKRLLNLGGCS